MLDIGSPKAPQVVVAPPLNEPVAPAAPPPAVETQPETPPAAPAGSDAVWAAADAGAMQVETPGQQLDTLKAQEPALEAQAAEATQAAATTTTTDPAKAEFEARQALDQLEANRREQTVTWAEEQVARADDIENATGHRPNDRDDKAYVAGNYMDAPAQRRTAENAAAPETEDWCAHFVSTAMQAAFEEKWAKLGFHGGLGEGRTDVATDGHFIAVGEIQSFADASFNAAQAGVDPAMAPTYQQPGQGESLGWQYIPAQAVDGARQPKPGDIVLFDGHTGILTEWNGDGTFTTVEGNSGTVPDPADVLPESVNELHYDLNAANSKRSVVGFAVPPYRRIG
ncbi:MAG: CHAP domain-containing protein [Candidatus Melainabacteria bacterium]